MTVYKYKAVLLYGFRLLMLLCGVSGAASLHAEDLDKSIVKIFVTRQEFDYEQPWQRTSASKSSGSGSIIEGNRILTCAHVVEFGEFIEVRKAKDARKYTATVKFVAPQYDLAVLEVDDPRFFAKTTPISLAALPGIGERVTVYGFPTGGDDLSVTSGIVSRIESIDYSYSDYSNLGVQIDAAINPGNSGGPVLQDNKLSGVAFQGRTQAQSIGYMIPTPVIKTFLRDIEDGRFDGPVPTLLKWQKLENPALRECYGVDDTTSGVLINKVHSCSALFGLMDEGDVLLSIDSMAVQNDGSVIIDENRKTSFETLLQLKGMHDTLTLALIRNGRRLELQHEISYTGSKYRLVDKIDLQPKYYIEDGFVFTTPSYYYFKGDAYWAYHNPKLSYYYYGEVLNSDSTEEIVLLSSVLADKSNVGYHDLTNRIIKRVNGKRIKQFSDLIEAFKTTEGSYHVIEDEAGAKYVLNTENLEQINGEIMKRYGIPQKMRL